MLRVANIARHVVRRVPGLLSPARAIRDATERARTSASLSWPQLVRARTEKITIAITAYCNLRCTGCRYGRDFMPGAILPLDTVRDVIDDAAAAGVSAVRLYGGEPLLHPDLEQMLDHARTRGVPAYVTTNGLLLGQQVERLHAAGLRKVTVGYYGDEHTYDTYVQRPGRYVRFVESLRTARRRFGPDQLQIQLNFLFSRVSCNAGALDAVLALARELDARIQVDIVHYSLPYFHEGPDRVLQFRPEDASAVRRFAARLLRAQMREPDRFTESAASLAAIPDWAINGPAMQVPCDAGKLIWIGADGSVKLCYVTFPLGNLHEKRLSEILYSQSHHAAARSAFQLNCPRCHCERGSRIEKHAPSHAIYRKRAAETSL